MKKNKHLGIHIDDDLHFKLKYISESEGRSMNGQILYLVRQCIAKYEAENGPIEKKERTDD